MDRIVIKYPSKKKFSIESDNELQDIPGDFLTIPYNNIVNLNISYYELGENENDENLEIVTNDVPPKINFNDLVSLG